MNEENDDKTRRQQGKEPPRRTPSRVILGRSTQKIIVPYIWLVSGFLAFSLFTTFSYMPDLPQNPEDHPHIHKKTPWEGSAFESYSAREPAVAVSKPVVLSKRSAEESSAFGKADLGALHLPLDAKTVVLDQVPVTHPMQNNPIMTVLKQARISEISIDDWNKLPGMASNLTDLYGSRIVSQSSQSNSPETGDTAGPIVRGMETCEEYRRTVPLEERYIGPAGMFNTGTNALEHHLRKNIENMKSVWQVPWGKNNHKTWHVNVCRTTLTRTTRLIVYT